MTAKGDIAAILLAAGRSVRFGSADKLLAPVNGEPLVLHSARTITALGPGRQIAICNDAAGPVAALLTSCGFEIVVNPQPERGLSSSLAAGIAACRNAQAALICLGDMPYVSAAHLNALHSAFDPLTAPIVASACRGVKGVPAIFAQSCFDGLLKLEGDMGARYLLADAQSVEIPYQKMQDIDNPEDI